MDIICNTISHHNLTMPLKSLYVKWRKQIDEQMLISMSDTYQLHIPCQPLAKTDVHLTIPIVNGPVEETTDKPKVVP